MEPDQGSTAQRDGIRGGGRRETVGDRKVSGPNSFGGMGLGCG